MKKIECKNSTKKGDQSLFSRNSIMEIQKILKQQKKKGESKSNKSQYSLKGVI
jgi:hypothetical protein